MGYQLGIDVGTTYTAAAVARDGRTEIFALGDRSASIPSVVFIGEGGTVLVGEGATRKATSEPGRVARGFKRRLGDQTPILLGGVPVSPEALIARLLQWTVHRVSEQEGEKPQAIGISHPANWGPYKKDLLDQAIKIAGLDVPVTALTEPEAAAIHYSSTERVDDGDVVAVYDLGGGTFDACALRKTSAHGFEILGKPQGIERLGGIDFDEAVFDYVLRSVDGGLQIPDPPPPGVVAAATNLRRECIEAKEALSVDTEVDVSVLFPDVQAQVRLTRSEFERMIQTPLAETTKALRRALEGAGVDPGQVKKVLLVGGSSRIPLVARMVSAELGRPVAVDVHPKHSVAFGAVIAAGAALKAADMVEPAVAGTTAAGVAAATAASPEQATAAAGGDGGAALADTVPSGGGDGAPPPDKPSGGPSRGLLVGGIVAAIAAIVVIVLVLGGGDEEGGDTTAADTGTAPTTTTTAQPFAGSLVPGEWEAAAPMPAARQQLGAASVKGLVYVVGGLTETARGTSDVFVYDRGINQWRPGPSLPEPLHHAAVVAYRGEIVVIGGWVPEGEDLIANPSSAVYVLRGSTWEEMPSLPEPRAAGAAAVVGDEIVLVGGQNASGELMDSTEIFDGESWRSGAPIPTPREHLAAASDGTYAYAVGGRELSADANVDALERYDPASDSWEQLAPMPTPRGSLGGAAMIKGELLVVVGGEVVEGALATVEGYSVTDKEWGPLPDMPTPRHGPGVTSVGPRVYVFGGATGAGHSASTDLVDALPFSVDNK